MKTVLITGANRGIGLSLVKNYHAQGWQVHATYRSEKSSQDLLELEGDNLTCHPLDVTDYQGLSEFANALPALDVLINNAGYYGQKAMALVIPISTSGAKYLKLTPSRH